MLFLLPGSPTSFIPDSKLVAAPGLHHLGLISRMLVPPAVRGGSACRVGSVRLGAVTPLQGCDWWCWERGPACCPRSSPGRREDGAYGHWECQSVLLAVHDRSVQRQGQRRLQRADQARRDVGCPRASGFVPQSSGKAGWLWSAGRSAPGRLEGWGRRTAACHGHALRAEVMNACSLMASFDPNSAILQLVVFVPFVLCFFLFPFLPI